MGRARKQSQTKAAKQAYEKKLYNLPENVAIRRRKNKEAKEKKAKLERKHKRAVKIYKAITEANPALKKAKRSALKNPATREAAKAQNLKRKEAIREERRRLEKLAGIKFLVRKAKKVFQKKIFVEKKKKKKKKKK